MNPNLPHSPIAVVGLSCLFPGAATPDDFWRNLINGVDSTSPATAAQFGVDPAIYHDPARRTADTTYFLRGGYVTAKVDIPDGMDKASGWSLYVAREALKDAGLASRADVLARCGVILGNLSFPTPESHQRIAPIYDAALSDAIGELLGVDGFELPRDAARIRALERDHLTARVRRQRVLAAPVVRQPDASDHGMDAVAVAHGILVALERQNPRALAGNQSFRARIKRTARAALRIRAEMREAHVDEQRIGGGHRTRQHQIGFSGVEHRAGQPDRIQR